MISNFKIRYSVKSNSYLIKCLIPDSPYNDISFKFDTGAAHTIITLSAFIKPNSEDYRQRFLIAEQLRNSHYKKNDFVAAFGMSHQCILCCVPKLILNGCMLEDFYFYLAVPTKKDEEIAREYGDHAVDRPKALLGMDFISCCDFLGRLGSRDKDNRLLIRFNESRYRVKKQWQDRKRVLNIDSIDFLKEFKSIIKPPIKDIKSMGVF